MSLEAFASGLPPRVLIAEDEPLIAFMLEDVMSAMGLDVVGPYASVGAACQAMADDTPTLALLDVNLIDGDVYPLADLLHARRVPLLFHTGSRLDAELKQRYAGSQVISKPSGEPALRRAVALLNHGASSGLTSASF
jgi:two-component system, response regulator PdtaR